MKKQLSPNMVDLLVSDINSGVSVTFESFFSLKPNMKPFKVEKDCFVEGDISGILSMSQERSEGTFIVTFPRHTIFNLLKIVYRRDFSEIDNSVKSGVGELTNVIYGFVKTQLNGQGYSLRMAIPHVVVGENHTIMSFQSDSTVVIPFETKLGSFYVQVTFHKIDHNKAVA